MRKQNCIISLSALEIRSYKLILQQEMLDNMCTLQYSILHYVFLYSLFLLANVNPQYHNHDFMTIPFHRRGLQGYRGSG